MKRNFPVHHKGEGFDRDDAGDQPIIARTQDAKQQGGSDSPEELLTGKSFCEQVEEKKKHHRVMLLSDVEGFFLTHDGDLVKKGGFAKGRLLKINATFPIVKDGIKYFKVENVKHHFIYIPNTPGSLKKIKGSDIKKMSSQIADKKGIDISDREVLNRLVEKTVENLSAVLESIPEKSKGLDKYEESAFVACDGFCYAEGKKGDDHGIAGELNKGDNHHDDNRVEKDIVRDEEIAAAENQQIVDAELQEQALPIQDPIIQQPIVTPIQTPIYQPVYQPVLPVQTSYGTVAMRSLLPFYGAWEYFFKRDKKKHLNAEGNNHPSGGRKAKGHQVVNKKQSQN